MKYENNDIASSMDSILKDPEYNKMFSSSSVLEKLAFKRVADEDLPTEIEVEFEQELNKEQLTVKAFDNSRADCLVCGKKRSGWTEADGVCKCASQNSCNPMVGCKENCGCGCKTKKAEVVMDTLIKSAFDSLMKASSDLEEAGLEDLATDTLILMNDLVVEAKKKGKKDDKADKAKEKMKAEKAKMREKAEKEKAKVRAEKEKAKARAEKEKAKAKADAEKEKADKAKSKAKLDK